MSLFEMRLSFQEQSHSRRNFKSAVDVIHLKMKVFRTGTERPKTLPYRKVSSSLAMKLLIKSFLKTHDFDFPA